MKNIFTTAFVLAFALPFLASASTAAFAPASVEVVPGQSFSMTVVVTPQEAADYTAKVAVAYPAGLLSVTNFTFSSGWLALSQPGYDSIDNSAGLMVKTAGYSGGFSSQKTFGTITFTAKAAGTATITFSGATQILDANNTNTFTSGGRALATISAPQALPVVTEPVSKPSTGTSANPSRTPLTAPKPTAHASAATSTAAVAASSSEPEASATNTQSVAATTPAHGSTRNTSIILGALAVLISFGCGIVIGRRQTIQK